MAEVIYTQTQLRQLIAQADRLGFYDDVIHFEKELAKLQNPGSL